MKTHRDLEAWKESVLLAESVYGVTGRFPKEELFGLVSQMRRAAVSVASNIAEGAARDGSKEFVRFLYMALGSVSELDTQIEISKRLGIGEENALNDVQSAASHVARLIQGLIRSLKHRSV